MWDRLGIPKICKLLLRTHSKILSLAALLRNHPLASVSPTLWQGKLLMNRGPTPAGLLFAGSRRAGHTTVRVHRLLLPPHFGEKRRSQVVPWQLGSARKRLPNRRPTCSGPLRQKRSIFLLNFWSVLCADCFHKAGVTTLFFLLKIRVMASFSKHATGMSRPKGKKNCHVPWAFFRGGEIKN